MDRSADNLYLTIVRKHFPDVTWEDVTATYAGNDHWLLVVRDKVFRFPKVPRDIDARTSEFLKHLASRSPVPVPAISVHKDSNTGIFYEVNGYISGVSFYPAVAKTFSRRELLAVARKLGAFLSAVHAFPISEVRKLALDELNPSDFWAYMKHNPRAYPAYRRIVFPHISRREQVWIERLFDDYVAQIRERPFQTKVTHADMWTYHIIVDADKHELTGIIDFWGRIADPASDFKAFEYYGQEFVREVYRTYTHSVDDDFERRRLFYTGRDEVHELARQLTLGNQDKIAEHKRSLSAYIAAHPGV